MASDITRRIERLRSRRAGTDRLERLTEAARNAVLAKSLAEQPWQKRAKNQPHTQYALGAMREVDEDYTRISIDTATRVGRQLLSSLTSTGYSIDFRLQGSVPLNVHIRGVSDVDLLCLDTGFLTYATAGLRNQRGLYTSPTSKTTVGVLSALRKDSEATLKSAFPAAVVDVSGSKAIKISGGSLARPVDVVPSHWHDTEAFQASGQEYDRGVTILNKAVPCGIDNLPFLHIKRIAERCDAVSGGLRKAIRLCKNVKADAEEDGTAVGLPSFDIAATMFHADMSALRQGSMYELAILAETQRHLDFLARSHEQAKLLVVPDGSRRIFDSASKLTGLNRLSTEMDELIRQVAKEQKPLLSYSEPMLSETRSAIASVYVPA